MTLHSFGIIPTFAIGGSGPLPGTANTPGNFPIVIGVGATDNREVSIQIMPVVGEGSMSILHFRP